MRYWWVNQNQTFEQETRGNYLWSPKRRRDGARNQYYENMREVAPGDPIFSFRERHIAALALARSFCYECPKPEEFGRAGPNWGLIGWKVDAAFTLLSPAIRPKDFIDRLRPLLPRRYSPLQGTGDGMQSVYLAEIGEPLARLLGSLIGAQAQAFLEPVVRDGLATIENVSRRGLDEWEDHIQETLVRDPVLAETEKAALVKARRGQGLFKQNLLRVEGMCRITKVDNPAHLVGSHIKPWRDSDNGERLDGENGLLLTPSTPLSRGGRWNMVQVLRPVDHLIDRGFISFEGDPAFGGAAAGTSWRSSGPWAAAGVSAG